MPGPETEVVRIDPVTGPPRRWLLEPRADDHALLREQVWSGCSWREVGTDWLADYTTDRPE